MPKRFDIKSVLIIGAGPIVIGQSCEFDYSGTQACQGLREEGIRVVLVNSNPATIMTDYAMADVTYIEPVRWQTVAKILENEKVDAILPTMGGQTALNCAIGLHEQGILEKHGVQMIGADPSVIEKAEDRRLFSQAMKKIGLETPKSEIAQSMEEASQIVERLGFPCVIRPSFTMGGSGGGIAHTQQEFEEICKQGLSLSPTTEILIDESLIGWKEFEMEVVRDKKDNCIIICSIENFDPMGVHTGDSITVAPAQTLTDKEFQCMRNASIEVLREIGVETGGANVQFGFCPKTGRMVVIEMNPRVSRSSALASKATGFPIARIAAKLAIGYTLDELKNEITRGEIPASFEPTIDYVVTKIPRFHFEKFPVADSRLTTQMKSIGEVMAIGSSFQESFQKALRSLEIGVQGLVSMDYEAGEEAKKIFIKNELMTPKPERIFYLADAFRFDMDIDEVYNCCRIDYWFLEHIKDIVLEETQLKHMRLNDLNGSRMFDLKRKGFSDCRLAQLLQVRPSDVRHHRYDLGILPVYKRVDTCSAEFVSATAYMYSTYGQACESVPSERRKIIILGGGPNRIGQGIEFDYCCTHGALAAREVGYETIMVNCNPETVSTDYDMVDRLYFEPITLEDVLSIVRCEKPEGVLVQYGGQTPLKLAHELELEGIRILGTSPEAIDRAEDRERFQQMIQKLKLYQPRSAVVKTVEEGIQKAQEIGYPLVIRPSYVLGGRAMEIVNTEKDLQQYIKDAILVSGEAAIVLDSFLTHAIEVDIDAVSDGKNVFVCAVMEHIEQAGVHSGDSSCSLPPYRISRELQETLCCQTQQMALELGVIGLMNVQFAIQDDEIYIIEVNPRASRTVPFVSKCVNVSLAKIATRVILGESLEELGYANQKIMALDYYCVKMPVFPFGKFPHADPILSPEMRSTGEVMGVGENFVEAYHKALLAASITLPESGSVMLSVCDRDKEKVVEIAKLLHQEGFLLYGTHGTANAIRSSGIPITGIKKVKQGTPNVVNMIDDGDIVFVINTTEGRQPIIDSSKIRQSAQINGVLYTTTLSAAFAIMQAIKFGSEKTVRSLQRLHNII